MSSIGYAGSVIFQWRHLPGWNIQEPLKSHDIVECWTNAVSSLQINLEIKDTFYPNIENGCKFFFLCLCFETFLSFIILLTFCQKNFYFFQKLSDLNELFYIMYILLYNIEYNNDEMRSFLCFSFSFFFK